MASSKDPTLSLNLGFSPSPTPTTTTHKPLPDSDFKLSLTLTLSSSVADHHHNQPATSPRSAVSSLSLSNGSAGVPTVNRRRQRDQTATTVPATSGTASQEVDAFRHNNYSSKSAAASDDEDEDLATHSNVRKKLRLTKDQSALLEESFKLHSTLNPKQKLALANRLNLRPRQVEVWFQNRRARTKLKQTEVDCELLKKWCETLTNENRRLQKEVQELRSLKTRGQAPFYMQLPAATLSMCPSCERINGGAELRRR